MAASFNKRNFQSKQALSNRKLLWLTFLSAMACFISNISEFQPLTEEDEYATRTQCWFLSIFHSYYYCTKTFPSPNFGKKLQNDDGPSHLILLDIKDSTLFDVKFRSLKSTKLLINSILFWLIYDIFQYFLPAIG